MARFVLILSITELHFVLVNLEWYYFLSRMTVGMLQTKDQDLLAILAKEFHCNNSNQCLLKTILEAEAYPFPIIISHHKGEEHHMEGISEEVVDLLACIEVVLQSLIELVVHTDEVVVHTLDFHSNQKVVEVAYHLAYCFADFHTCYFHLYGRLLHSSYSVELDLNKHVEV